MGEVSMLPANPEADWVYLYSNGRNLPSNLQLPAEVMTAMQSGPKPKQLLYVLDFLHILRKKLSI